MRPLTGRSAESYLAPSLAFGLRPRYIAQLLSRHDPVGTNGEPQKTNSAIRTPPSNVSVYRPFLGAGAMALQMC